MANLGVNVDHVATLRQARRGVEPDPVRAAHEAEIAGADCITVHLREDRRHIQASDLDRLRPLVTTKLNLEMAATEEMVGIALRVRPDMVTLVPEGRAEITTEGGLPVDGRVGPISDVVRRLAAAGVPCSAFIDPDPRQVEASASAGFAACEIHTGPYAAAFRSAAGNIAERRTAAEIARVADAGRRVVAAGIRFNAGHALNYHNVAPIAALPGMWELHIGHSIIARAVYAGMREAVREMKRLIDDAARGG